MRRLAQPLIVLVVAGCASVSAPPPTIDAPPPTFEQAQGGASSTARTVVKKGAPPAKQEAGAPTVASAPPPPLDLKSLETRLKETPAIGTFTKLSLKNQVDDLLEQFRAYYKGALKTTLAELRRPYEMLLLKVLSLLQDADPPLAKAIVASREAIWGILSDPAKFATL